MLKIFKRKKKMKVKKTKDYSGVGVYFLTACAFVRLQRVPLHVLSTFGPQEIIIVQIMLGVFLTI